MAEAELIYGFDPVCGWCYGVVPAIRRVRAEHADLPVRLVMAGLVIGDRVGPYAVMKGYIRRASERLRAVTGRAPSEAFFDLIRRPGVRGDSGPPSVAIDLVRRERPHATVDFAHRVIEAHFEDGADLNDPATYAPWLGELGLPMAGLDRICDPEAQAAAWAEGCRLGIRSFPTLAVARDGRVVPLPSEYDPGRLSALVGQALT